MTRRPGFFIIGAPKCGTTALSEYLRGHPQVFMCDPKEPHFFNFDHANRPTQSVEQYLRLFRSAGTAHQAVGEASTRYLSSTVAVDEILRFRPDARLIAMVRNPLDMAYSLHAQNVQEPLEDELDFERAWRLQGPRSAGAKVPATCAEPAHILYGPVCLLGRQLECIMDRARPEQLMTIVFDDFVRDTAGVYANVLRFLQVECDGRQNFPATNQGRGIRSRWLHRWLLAGGALKRRMGIRRGLGVYKLVNRFNSRYQARSPVSPEFQAELSRYFRADVLKLSSLLGRDLSGWLNGRGPGPKE